MMCSPATLRFKPSTPSSIEKLLKSLKTSKATGPDNIPGRMLRDASRELAIPLCFLVNVSMSTGTFPTAEKLAKVKPIYKSGERSIFDNYCPISILNALSKILEKVVSEQIIVFLEEHNLLYEKQYGFRRNKCTQDAVLHLHDHIRQKMSDKNLTGALYIDLRKAFDTVSHSCLLSKLPCYGISGIEHKWISDYLFNRKQYVTFNNIQSEPESITHGVPQGSILGPLLFVILINDAYQCLEKCTMLMYADDTVLLFSDSSSKSIEETLNYEGEQLFQWFMENNLILNLKPGKTELVIYGTAQKLKTQPPCNVEINGSIINHAPSYEYLGITFDKHLTMSEQTTKVCKKITKRLKLLNRVRENLSQAAASAIYNSMIEPIAFYCAPIYLGIDPYLDKLTRLQNKARRVINCANQQSIVEKIKRQSVTEVFKYLHGLKKNQSTINFKFFDHSIHTRGNGDRLVIPKLNNEAGRRSFVVQGALAFNTLPVELRKERSICRFKQNLANSAS